MYRLIQVLDSAIPHIAEHLRVSDPYLLSLEFNLYVTRVGNLLVLPVIGHNSRKEKRHLGWNLVGLFHGFSFKSSFLNVGAHVQITF
jgi:hypothetical protein